MVDQEQFTRYWTQAQPIVAGYINSMVPDFHEAEDLLQNVAVVLLRKFAEYDPARPFAGWAMGVAKYEILASKRDHARSFLSFRPEIADAVADAYGVMAGELDERADALRRCLARVEGRARDVLRLRYQEALKPGQIAPELGMSAGAVRVMLWRARDALRQCIERGLSAKGEPA